MRQERLNKILPCVGGKCTDWSVFWSLTVGGWTNKIKHENIKRAQIFNVTCFSQTANSQTVCLRAPAGTRVRRDVVLSEVLAGSRCLLRLDFLVLLFTFCLFLDSRASSIEFAVTFLKRHTWAKAIATAVIFINCNNNVQINCKNIRH